MKFWKRLSFLWLLFPSLLWAGGQKDQFFNFTDFHGGLNSNYSSLTIADNEVHDSRNVYFTKDNAVSKRKGYSLYGSTGSFSFQAAWQYVDATNNSWLIVRSSDAIRASPGNGSFTVKIATVPPLSTSLVSAVSAFGKIYFVDNVQGVYSWDGTSTAFVSGSPKGTLITEFHGRLWVAGLPVPNQNNLNASAYLDGATWTTGTLATDPVLLQIGLNDRADGITALWSGYNDVLYLFKNLSINSLTGFDQTDFTVRVLSREAGCIDSGSLQAFRGYLYFMSQRGLEQFDGAFPVRISNKIKDKIDPATTSSFNQRSWTQDTAADWGAGTYTNPVYVDTQTVSGNLQTTFPDRFSNLRDGTSGTKKVWGSGCNAGTIPCSTNVVVSGGNLVLTVSPSSGTFGVNEFVYASTPIVNYSPGTTIYALINSVTLGTDNKNIYAMGINSVFNSSDPFAADSFYIYFESTTTGKAFLRQVTDRRGHFCNYCSGDIATPLAVSLYLATTTYQVTVNGVVISSGTHSYPNTSVYPFIENILQFGPGTYAMSVGNFDVIPQTFLYSSPSQALGSSINSFGSFDVTQDLTNGGSIAYSVCTSANSNMIPKTCVPTSANAQITNSTSSFVQVVATFTTTGVTDLPSLGLFTVHWNEGTTRPKMSSVVYDNRYWLALTTTTADAQNDATVIVSENKGEPIFSLFDIQAGAYVLYRNALYHADANATGNVYLDDTGYSDNGAAINGYITTKDYAPSGINQDKYFESLYVTADALGNYNLSTSYMIDRNPTLNFSLSDINQSEQTGLINLNLPFPFDSTHQKFGRTISFTFSNSTINQPFNLYGGTLVYRERASLGNLNAQ